MDINKMEMYHIDSIVYCYYFIGEEEKANSYLSRYQQLEEEFLKNTRPFEGRGKYIGRAMMIEGLIQQDKKKLLDGITSALRDYIEVEKIQYDHVPWASEVIDNLILGKERGISINVMDIPEEQHRPIFRFFEDV
jgi:hypothetical protein